MLQCCRSHIQVSSKARSTAKANDTDWKTEVKTVATCHTRWKKSWNKIYPYLPHPVGCVHNTYHNVNLSSQVKNSTKSQWPIYLHWIVVAYLQAQSWQSTCTESWRPGDIYMHWIMVTYLHALNHGNPSTSRESWQSTCTESWQPIYMHWIMATYLHALNHGNLATGTESWQSTCKWVIVTNLNALGTLLNAMMPNALFLGGGTHCFEIGEMSRICDQGLKEHQNSLKI